MIVADQTSIRAKGWVRVDLYDPETGQTIDTIENHNVVTNSAAEVIARALGDPLGVQQISTSEVLDTSSTVDNTGYYPLQLSVQRGHKVYKTLQGTGDEVLSLAESRRVLKLNRVRVSGVDKTIGTEVYLSDERTGELTFADPPADGTTISVEYTVVYDDRVRFFPGSELVTSGSTQFRRSTAKDVNGIPVPEGDGYIIDEDTGTIWFDTPRQNVSVSYQYLALQGLAYMGLSDRPENHPIGVPVIYSEEYDKGRSSLDKEYVGSRMPLLFPSEITVGSAYSESVFGNGYDRVFTLSHRDLIEITEAFNISTGESIDHKEIEIVDPEAGRIRFPSPPASTDVIRLTYRWNSGTTVVFVADFPQGVPGPHLVENAQYSTVTGDRDEDNFVDMIYHLPSRPTIVRSVVLDGQELTEGDDYQVSGDAIALTSTPQQGVPLVITYDYMSERADIYSVGLFSAKEGGILFALSGLGPITKDPNTGMRVTWSITF